MQLFCDASTTNGLTVCVRLGMTASSRLGSISLCLHMLRPCRWLPASGQLHGAWICRYVITGSPSLPAPSPFAGGLHLPYPRPFCRRKAKHGKKNTAKQSKAIYIYIYVYKYISFCIVHKCICICICICISSRRPASPAGRQANLIVAEGFFPKLGSSFALSVPNQFEDQRCICRLS